MKGGGCSRRLLGARERRGRKEGGRRPHSTLANHRLLKDIWVVSHLDFLGTCLALWKPMARLCADVPSFESLKFLCVYVCVRVCGGSMHTCTHTHMPQHA